MILINTTNIYYPCTVAIDAVIIINTIMFSVTAAGAAVDTSGHAETYCSGCGFVSRSGEMPG